MQLAELQEYSRQLALTVQRLEQAISNQQQSQDQLYLSQPASNPGKHLAGKPCIDTIALNPSICMWAFEASAGLSDTQSPA